MYYLITINGSMISGRLITKSPPTAQFLKTVVSSSQDKPTKPPEALVTIKHLTIEELLAGALPEDKVPFLEPKYTEGELIRKYLDNL